MTTTTHPPGATLHLGGEAWASPSLEPLLVPIDTVHPYPGNPRRHDQDSITSSIRDLGCWRAVAVQAATGHCMVGNGMLRGLLDLGATVVPLVSMDVTEARARAIVARDNRTSDLSFNDLDDLVALLSVDESRELSGYDEEAFAQLLEDANASDPTGDEDSRAPTTGELLELVDVTFGEPKHRVHHGEVWQLGRHTLVVAKLHTEHQLWAKRLKPDHLFAPYPEPYITCSTVAQDQSLLLVQPNVYLAGHLLDKHATAYPAQTVERIAEAQ